MKHSKSSLFLMEMIIALLFFALSSTVCIRLFVKSHILSTQTSNLNYAVTQAQNLAECFMGLEGDMVKLQALFEGSTLENNNCLLSIQDGDYLSTLLLTPADMQSSDSTCNIISADITVYYQESLEPIYSLHVDHYIAERPVTYE